VKFRELVSARSKSCIALAESFNLFRQDEVGGFLRRINRFGEEDVAEVVYRVC